MYLNNLGHYCVYTTARLPREDGCFTAALAAFALDTASEADRGHVTAPEDGIQVAQVGSPVRMAERVALVPQEVLAGSMVAVAGSRAAAGSVR